jgi:hypothetical protein
MDKRMRRIPDTMPEGRRGQSARYCWPGGEKERRGNTHNGTLRGNSIAQRFFLAVTHIKAFSRLSRFNHSNKCHDLEEGGKK